MPIPDPDAPPAPRKRRNPQDVKLTADEIRAEVDRLSRGPFQEALSVALAGAPDVAAMAALGVKSPDRWAQAVIMLAKLAGYSEKVEVNANVFTQLHTLSDSDLQARLDELVAASRKEKE